MGESEFVERMAKLRERFASKLAGKIQETEAAAGHLAGGGIDAVDAVAAAYRRFHDICGIGPTIGFKATGQAARTLDGLLIGPFRDHRGLSADELAKLKEGLELLRSAARIEIQSAESNQELAR